VTQDEPVARGHSVDPLALDPLDEPMPAAELDDRSGRELVLALEAADAIATGSILRDDVVRRGQ